MPEIIVKLGDRVVQKYYMYKNNTLTVGRAPDNDIAIENPAVSRRHSSITHINGRYIIEDNASANGTYVNGVKVTKTELLDKDVITVGKHKLHFYNQDMVDAGPAEESEAPAAGEVPTARLVVLQGKHKEQVFPITGVETSIGRTTENDVRLHRDFFVSKHHAVIGRRGNKYLLRDLDSWRGTWVNGERVQECELQDGDEIQFGPKVTVRFNLVDGSQEGAAERAMPQSGMDDPGSEQDNLGGTDTGRSVAPRHAGLDDDSISSAAQYAAEEAAEGAAMVGDEDGESTVLADEFFDGDRDASDGDPSAREAALAAVSAAASNLVREKYGDDSEDDSVSADSDPEQVNIEDLEGTDHDGAEDEGMGGEVPESLEAPVESAAMSGDEGSGASVLDQPPPAEPEPAAADAPSAQGAGAPPDIDLSQYSDEQRAEIELFLKSLENPSKVIRKQAARKLKKLTGVDYDVE